MGSIDPLPAILILGVFSSSFNSDRGLEVHALFLAARANVPQKVPMQWKPFFLQDLTSPAGCPGEDVSLFVSFPNVTSWRMPVSFEANGNLCLRVADETLAREERES